MSKVKIDIPTHDNIGNRIVSANITEISLLSDGTYGAALSNVVFDSEPQHVAFVGHELNTK